MMGQQVTHHHHVMTNKQKAWYLKDTLRHATIHPIWYRTYHMTRIKIQVCQIILRWIHLTHQKTNIINKDNVQKRTNINAGVKRVSTTQPKIAQSLQISYLNPRANQRWLSSNWMRTHYSTGFISYLSWIHLNLFYHNLRKHKCYLWTIHPQEGKKYQIMIKRSHGNFCMHTYMHLQIVLERSFFTWGMNCTSGIIPPENYWPSWSDTANIASYCKFNYGAHTVSDKYIHFSLM